MQQGNSFRHSDAFGLISMLLFGMLGALLFSAAQADTFIVPSHAQACAAMPTGAADAAAAFASLRSARQDLDPKYAGGCRGDAAHLLNLAFETVLDLQEQELQQPAFPVTDPREKSRRAALLKALTRIHAASAAIDASLKDDQQGGQAISRVPVDDAIHALESAYPKP
jgi:hypothetical protein